MRKLVVSTLAAAACSARSRSPVPSGFRTRTSPSAGSTFSAFTTASNQMRRPTHQQSAARPSTLSHTRTETDMRKLIIAAPAAIILFGGMGDANLGSWIFDPIFGWPYGRAFPSGR